MICRRWRRRKRHERQLCLLDHTPVRLFVRSLMGSLCCAVQVLAAFASSLLVLLLGPADAPSHVTNTVWYVLCWIASGPPSVFSTTAADRLSKRNAPLCPSMQRSLLASACCWCCNSTKPAWILRFNSRKACLGPCTCRGTATAGWLPRYVVVIS